MSHHVDYTHTQAATIGPVWADTPPSVAFEPHCTSHPNPDVTVYMYLSPPSHHLGLPRWMTSTTSTCQPHHASHMKTLTLCFQRAMFLFFSSNFCLCGWLFTSNCCCAFSRIRLFSLLSCWFSSCSLMMLFLAMANCTHKHSIIQLITKNRLTIMHQLLLDETDKANEKYSLLVLNVAFSSIQIFWVWVSPPLWV